jgi:ABC-type polysaccharide/polyol phosphate export permease
LAQIKVRYRKSMAGFIWVCLNPLLLFGAQAFIFKNILNINLDHYLLFLLTGLIPWTILTQGIEMGIPLLYNSRELIKNFCVTPAVLVSSFLIDHILTSLVTFSITLVAVYFIHPFPITEAFILLPACLLVLLIGLWNMIFTLGLLNVFFRDTKFVISFLHQLLFFLTPVFYPVEMLPTFFKALAQINPYYILILPIRNCLYPEALANLSQSMSVALGFIFLHAIFNQILWKKERNSFYLKI